MVLYYKYMKPLRNEKGQFLKGTHWRKKQLFWDKNWLDNEYTNKKRSSGELSKQFLITEQAILFWLRKFNIKRRTVSEAREVKYWGGKNEQNSQWKGKKVGYQALHGWIKRNFKSKKFCDKCGIKGKFINTKKGIRWNLDWSNISHKYLRDRNDWQYLCKKCHMLYDKRSKNNENYGNK